ncbi:MAG: DNA topoisomerase 3 [Selenomonadaceae bacterium]|nr:DNA topoisomerase 3 [Selenomonadaceae bacterium]
MRLYIAEKPSMARELASCLKNPQKRTGYIQTAEGIVTWLFGHVLEQVEPAEYNPKYKLWDKDDLPIVPKEWKLKVTESSAEQFQIVKALIEKADEIVHAGDPDREGQLLVDEVLDFVGNKKPVKRILLNALDETSIKRALKDLRDNKEFFNLKQSALARSRADWLIGMNLSRAYTLAAQRHGYRKLVLPIGRVKTPTLALVVRREREIQNFKPVDFYNIIATFEHANGNFLATFKPTQKMLKLESFDDSGRLIDKDFAQELLKTFAVEPFEGKISSYKTTERKEQPPLPYSLSTLQVAAGKAFGYSPQVVLNTAQSLYEKKLTTYPRSDCEYLPTNQIKDVPEIVKHLGGMSDENLRNMVKHADIEIKSRAWNDEKISAHHAITPTRTPVKVQLSEAEMNIYKTIARNYLMQFYPEHIFDETIVTVNYKKQIFGARGKVIKQNGWREFYIVSKKSDEKGTDKKSDDENIADEKSINGNTTDEKSTDDNSANENNSTGNSTDEKSTDKKSADENKNDKDDYVVLPHMEKGDAVEYKDGILKKGTTTPPKRFTASGLIEGMKNIHKYVKNPEAKKQLKDVYGIGTEATRAAIIDDLIQRKFLTVNRKALYPTDAAYLLIDALPDDMTYPDATAIWEDKLYSMSEGDGSLDDFLTGQVNFTSNLVKAADDAKFAEESKYKCPNCGSALTKRQGKNGDFWGCSAYPKCKTTFEDDNGQPDFEGKLRAARQKILAEESKYKCPNCGSALIKRQGRSGDFWGCSAYPKCKTTFEDDNDKPDFEGKLREARQKILAEESKYKCPNCGSALIKRRGRNGDFWGCSAYPKCKTTFNDDNGQPNFDGKKFIAPKNEDITADKKRDNSDNDNFDFVISSADF